MANKNKNKINFNRSYSTPNGHKVGPASPRSPYKTYSHYTGWTIDREECTTIIGKVHSYCLRPTSTESTKSSDQIKTTLEANKELNHTASTDSSYNVKDDTGKRTRSTGERLSQRLHTSNSNSTDSITDCETLQPPPSPRNRSPSYAWESLPNNECCNSEKVITSPSGSPSLQWRCMVENTNTCISELQHIIADRTKYTEDKESRAHECLGVLRQHKSRRIEKVYYELEKCIDLISLMDRNEAYYKKSQDDFRDILDTQLRDCFFSDLEIQVVKSKHLNAIGDSISIQVHNIRDNVTSYDNLHSMVKNNKDMKILLTGPVGSGKTEACKTLLKSWIDETDTSSAVHKYSLFVYIPVDKINEEIIEYINQNIFDNYKINCVTDLETLLLNHSNACFIFDGFEKGSEKQKHKVEHFVKKCVTRSLVIITSSPGVFDNNKVNNTYEIVRLSPETQEICLQKQIEYLALPNCVSASITLKSDQIDTNLLHDALRRPLGVYLLGQLVKQGVDLDGSPRFYSAYIDLIFRKVLMCDSKNSTVMKNIQTVAYHLESDDSPLKDFITCEVLTDLIGKSNSCTTIKHAARLPFVKVERRVYKKREKLVLVFPSGHVRQFLAAKHLMENTPSKRDSLKLTTSLTRIREFQNYMLKKHTIVAKHNAAASVSEMTNVSD